MKDPLLDYIDKNRDELDVHAPGDGTWDKINARIGPKKNGRKLIVYLGSLAALLVLGIYVINRLAPQAENDLAAIEASSDHEPIKVVGITDSTRTTDVQNTTTREYHFEGNNKIYRGFREVLTHISRDGDDFSSIGGEFTYTFMVTDANGCATSNMDVGYFNPYGITGDGTHSFGRYNLYDSQQNSHVQYEVDRYYEQYEEFTENAFESPLNLPLSTFGIDVDGAGYSNMRRFIMNGYLPPKNAVKLEEMVNYFNYDLPEPKGEHPFSVTTEVAKCPWKEDHLLMQVALKGESVKMDEEQTNNLVFLIDVSGSMNSPDKLPLLKKSLNMLVAQMGRDDKIAIVVYAGAAGLVLPPTSGGEKSRIIDAIDRLNAGGSTAGGEGIELAYKVAKEAFQADGNNRIILATDGDFNVGISDDDELVELIEEKRKTGIYLSVLGFGTGNLQSSKMEKLADNGNGNYYYIDNLFEAKKVLVNEIGGTLITIAKDVKLQLEFNPETVRSYRLLGYENRKLLPEDFDNDLKDAGDLGSGHTIVALYEIVPADSLEVQNVSNLRYQKKVAISSMDINEELAVLKLRYKKPKSSKSRLMKTIIQNTTNEKASDNLCFASAVAEFGMLIRESMHKGDASFESVLARAKASIGADEHGYRAEFIQLVQRAEMLMREYRQKLDIATNE